MSSAVKDSREDSRQVIKVGSRKSELALIQTKYVVKCLQQLFPTIKWEIYTMTTVGDRVLNKSLPKIGEKSLFTKDLEDALVHGGVDFVVHSLKDLPTQLPHGMCIGAVLEREDARDALVLNSKFTGHKLQDLPAGSLIGTSSLRRSAQLARKYSHLKVCDIRGNLNTRLAKLDALTSKFSGIILANAGLNRMGWNSRVDQVIEPSELLYAVGQGALAVECRVNDSYVLNLLSKLCDFKTQCRILTERSFLKTLGGGCSAPVGINSIIDESINSIDQEFTLKATGGVWSLDGQEEVVDDVESELKVESAKKTSNDSDDDSEASPTKRLKLNEESLDRSPEVISESTKSDKNATELVNIHGKVFDSCPYSGQSTTSKVEAKNDNKTGCPVDKKFDHLKMPIGQDFMGECPVLNTEQKITFDVGADGGGDSLKCPIAGHSFVPAAGHIDKCPFLSKQKEEAVAMIDYETDALKNSNPEPKSLVENLPDVKLYCGLFCHESGLKSSFDQCEGLGIELAQKLISAGALEIMKKAQDEIHSKLS